ncbi:MAG TPA: type II toxin-antitoxin system VapC family toxin [Nevskiaceae bacterium]|nr:type II toxin-antitoxin system VapC family toxin [Nevskiaceae bacterium]
MTELHYLLDTNICICIRRAHPLTARARFSEHERGCAGLSIITWGELLYGATHSQHPRQNRAKLDALVAFIPVIGMPDATAEHYGDIREHLARSGTIIGANDLWIAAHARAAKLTLVTHNVQEFKRVEGLGIEDWTS